MTLGFSVFNESSDASNSELRIMASDARKKTEEKPAIIEKLEKVRGLTHAIEDVGDAVKEVSNTLHMYRCLSFPHSALFPATSGYQGSLDNSRRTYQGLIVYIYVCLEIYSFPHRPVKSVKRLVKRRIALWKTLTVSYR